MDLRQSLMWLEKQGKAMIPVLCLLSCVLGFFSAMKSISDLQNYILEI